ncbi:MAG: hypothetical protein R3Y05_04935 [bacterium]
MKKDFKPILLVLLIILTIIPFANLLSTKSKKNASTTEVTGTITNCIYDATTEEGFSMITYEYDLTVTYVWKGQTYTVLVEEESILLKDYIGDKRYFIIDINTGVEYVASYTSFEKFLLQMLIITPFTIIGIGIILTIYRINRMQQGNLRMGYNKSASVYDIRHGKNLNYETQLIMEKELERNKNENND